MLFRSAAPDLQGKSGLQQRVTPPLPVRSCQPNRRLGGGAFAPAPSRPEGEDGADEIVNGPGKLTLRAELLADADKHQGLDGGVPGNGFHDRPSVAEVAAGSR